MIEGRDGSSGKQLIGYVVASGGALGDDVQSPTFEADLRDLLKRFLPEYMVPLQIGESDTLTLTATGTPD